MNLLASGLKVIGVLNEDLFRLIDWLVVVLRIWTLTKAKENTYISDRYNLI